MLGVALDLELTIDLTMHVVSNVTIGRTLPTIEVLMIVDYFIEIILHMTFVSIVNARNSFMCNSYRSSGVSLLLSSITLSPTSQAANIIKRSL